MVERYFDAFLYLANWGTRELILRLPARLVDPEVVQRYCSGDAVSAWTTGDHLVVAAVSEDEEGDFEWAGEGVLASLLPLRAELLAGDLRALYLLWLISVQVGEVLDDAVEPAVPALLSALTGSQSALVEFLRIDWDLVDVAAGGSPPAGEERRDVTRWVAGLSGADRDALLIGLLEGDDPLLRAETLRRAGPDRLAGTGLRTAAELLDEAAAQQERRELAERDRRAALAPRARIVLRSHGGSGWRGWWPRATGPGRGWRRASRRGRRRATTPQWIFWLVCRTCATRPTSCPGWRRCGASTGAR